MRITSYWHHSRLTVRSEHLLDVPPELLYLKLPVEISCLIEKRLVLELLSILLPIGHFLDVIREGQRQLQFLGGGWGLLSFHSPFLLRSFLLLLFNWLAMLFDCLLNKIFRLVVLSLIWLFWDELLIFSFFNDVLLNINLIISLRNHLLLGLFRMLLLTSFRAHFRGAFAWY
jgi:hypothetical protein